MVYRKREMWWQKIIGVIIWEMRKICHDEALVCHVYEKSVPRCWFVVLLTVLPILVYIMNVDTLAKTTINK